MNTGSNGEALFGYTIPRIAGIYNVQITASATGYANGIGTTSFTGT